MKTPLFLAAAALAGAPAFAASERYDFTGFAEVSVEAGIQTTITQSDVFSVEVEAESERALRDIELRQSGDRLTLTRPMRWSGLALLRGRPDIAVTITMPDLDAVRASSGAAVEVTGTVDGDLEVDVSSGALVAMEGIVAEDVRGDASSGALIRMSGSCETVHADASSGASFDMQALFCEEGWADASSGAVISLHVTQSIRADASSGASISVHGDPDARDIEHSSGGAVRLH